MSQSAIVIEQLGKRYRIGRKLARSKTWSGAISNALRGHANRLLALADGGGDSDTIWALRDVSLDVRPGEVIGLIGRNGAGKSTLLKILSRIAYPTEGRAIVHGRVGSLLEVGTGFHPELTGRENIYLNGAILGMRRAEITRVFDEIVAFAEIDKFLDTPVKRYSSGMYVRLAFAVAAHLSPEVMLVDEVLAVGDMQFQKKCLGKMGDVANSGRTIVFVSHNMGAISKLCHRCALLEDGQVSCIGPTAEVVSRYVASAYPQCARRTFSPRPDKPGQIMSVALEDEQSEETSTFGSGAQVRVRIEYTLRRPMRGGHVACLISTADGTLLLATADTDADASGFDVRPAGSYTTSVDLPRGMLNVGTYYVTVSVGIPGVGVMDRQEALNFTLVDTGDVGSMKEQGRRGGLIVMTLPWRPVTERDSNTEMQHAEARGV